MTVIMSNLIGVAMRLKIDNTVYTLAAVKLYCPLSAEYSPKMIIEANIGSMFMTTSMNVRYISCLKLNLISSVLIYSILSVTNFYQP